MNRLRFARNALRRKAPTPLGALARGLIAGALGAAAQSAFFKIVKAPAPTRPPRGEGKPEGDDVSALEAVAERTVEGLMKRELDGEQKPRSASLIHVAFGA